MVGEDGFEPSKHYATDLQSAPFGHSGNHPKVASPDVFRKASAKIVFSNDNQFKTPNNFKVFNTSSTSIPSKRRS